MKFLAVTLLALVAAVSTRHITLEDVIDLENNSVYGYLNRFAIPLATEIRKAEEEGSQNPSRIFGGSFAELGQFPYQAGLVLQIPSGTFIAGGVLISPSRVLSAAHNFYDFVSTVTSVTVVLGSTTIKTGGTRLTPSGIVLHEHYNIPDRVRNDIAMVNLAGNVITSGILAPIALPSGSQLDEDFAGDVGIASGFGRTANVGGVVANQRLSFVHMPVITNDECAKSYSFIHSSNVCTSGVGDKNICSGDSGGPLAVARDGKPLLIGITSFGPGVCESDKHSGYARVTYYIDWIKERL